MRSSFVQAYVIPSGSMEPTILVGDHIFVNKVAYGLDNPRNDRGRSPCPDCLRVNICFMWPRFIAAT